MKNTVGKTLINENLAILMGGVRTNKYSKVIRKQGNVKKESIIVLAVMLLKPHSPL